MIRLRCLCPSLCIAMATPRSRRVCKQLEMVVERLERRFVQSATPIVEIAAVSPVLADVHSQVPEFTATEAVAIVVDVRSRLSEQDEFLFNYPGEFSLYQNWSDGTYLLAGCREHWIGSSGFELVWASIEYDQGFRLYSARVNPSFGDQGRLVLDFPAGAEYSDYLRPHVLRDSDGGALIVNFGWDATTKHPVATFHKLTPEGQLDTSFAAQGVAQEIPVGTRSPYVHRDSLGRTIIGSDDKWLHNHPVTKSLVRFRADGTLDPTFGDNGVVTITGTLPGWFTYHLVESVPDGGFRIRTVSYHQENIYHLGEDGRLLSSESNNGFELPRLEFSGVPATPNAAESTQRAISATAAVVVPVKVTEDYDVGANDAGSNVTTASMLSESKAVTLQPASNIPAGISQPVLDSDFVAAFNETESALDRVWSGLPLDAEALECWWDTVS